ncbi:hypothetical protein D5086_010246 [Populus alba]|uniref:Uncharacterized protein n=1 Tax=Populus alba TaxID=43335 RepID=A0ACC4C9K0_POPAL
MAKNKEAHVDPVTSSSSCQTPATQNHIESSAPCVGMSIQIPVVDPQLIQMAENSSVKRKPPNQKPMPKPEPPSSVPGPGNDRSYPWIVRTL